MWYSERKGFQSDGRHGCSIANFTLEAPALASNECDYGKLMYKGSGLVTLCRKEWVYTIAGGMASTWGCLQTWAICFCILKSRYYRSQFRS